MSTIRISSITIRKVSKLSVLFHIENKRSTTMVEKLGDLKVVIITGGSLSCKIRGRIFSC